MIPIPDSTHDPQRNSWVESANDPSSPFPIQNLPFGVFRGKGDGSDARVGVAIGGMILDLAAAAQGGLLRGTGSRTLEACSHPTLNTLMGLPAAERWMLRRALSDVLATGSPHRANGMSALVPMADVEMVLPAAIGDYTDFYASIHHATHVGSMFRPDQPLLPNYRYVPIGYHGRSSSVVPSGTPVRRPSGQIKEDGEGPPVFAPSRQLDYELEVGCFVGPGNMHGEPILIERAEEHLFGLVLLNDWSARDIQKWEYVPLGPFLAKNFATSLSPWVITMEALAPFRVPASRRAPSDPAPLPYLSSQADRIAGGIEILLEVLLHTKRMREAGRDPTRVSRTSFSEMYWTFAQMLTHHASNGCPLRPGDLLGSGTVSGLERESQGCLLEVAERGKLPFSLPGGETRVFLEDGDEVILRGRCERDGARWIGFGECRGRVISPGRA